MADPPPFDFGTLFDSGGVLLTGGTLRGWPVAEFVIRTTDGRQQTIQLPQPTEGQPGVEGSAAANPLAPETMTPMQRDVVQAIDEMMVGSVLSYTALAKKAGCANSGPFRDFVKRYAAESGRIEAHEGGRGWEKIE